MPAATIVLLGVGGFFVLIGLAALAYEITRRVRIHLTVKHARDRMDEELDDLFGRRRY